MIAPDDPGFGLYVHWPFCAAKCPYCDFNSHVVARVDQRRWARALAAEVARLAAQTPGRRLRSVFFGGGTPSLMEAETVAAVLTAARAWDWDNDIEVTLEANPTSAEAARFEGYRQAGVDRVSLGVQALNDSDLRALGRMHDTAQALEAVAMARAAFDRVSFDLIYARQHQTVESWEAELSQALTLGLDHLSLYQLTVEPGTPFARRHATGGLHGLPDEDATLAFDAVTEGCATAAGLRRYEVSNWSRPGAESRHNLIYWRSGDWAAVGPGAHGRLTLDGVRVATEAARMPGDWLARAEAGCAETLREALTPADTRAELLAMGLRLAEGLPMERVEVASQGLSPLTLTEQIDAGRLEIAEGHLRTTDIGRPLTDALVEAILPD
ncbi:MAG: radical SAM family heme chaperone HemW [Paracoccaceae bacterium]